MKTKTRSIALLFTLPLCSTLTQVSGVETRHQRDEQNRAALYGESPLIYYEAFNLPAEETANSRVDITFRISRGFFIFIRNEKFTGCSESPSPEKSDLTYPFIAKTEISVELLDRTGVSVARELVQKEVGTNDPENTSLQGSPRPLHQRFQSRQTRTHRHQRSQPTLACHSA